MAQSATVQAPTRSDVIDNLRLARGKAETAEWFASRPDVDVDTVRDLAQTAIYALEAVIRDVAAVERRELRRDPAATLALAERDV